MSIFYKASDTKQHIVDPRYKANDDQWHYIKNAYVKQVDGWHPVYTYDWEPQEWQACSKRCGGGEQIREIKCKRNDGLYRHDDFCYGMTKPDTVQECNTQSCWNPAIHCYANVLLSGRQEHYATQIRTPYVDSEGVTKFRTTYAAPGIQFAGYCVIDDFTRDLVFQVGAYAWGTCISVAGVYVTFPAFGINMIPIETCHNWGCVSKSSGCADQVLNRGRLNILNPLLDPIRNEKNVRVDVYFNGTASNPNQSLWAPLNTWTNSHCGNGDARSFWRYHE